jgi:hypothetical protein
MAPGEGVFANGGYCLSLRPAAYGERRSRLKQAFGEDAVADRIVNAPARWSFSCHVVVFLC